MFFKKDCHKKKKDQTKEVKASLLSKWIILGKKKISTQSDLLADIGQNRDYTVFE